MIVWSVPTLFFAGVVLLIDYIIRRRKWSENTGAEKTSLVLRGRGKAAASNRALVAGFLYCVAVTVASLML